MRTLWFWLDMFYIELLCPCVGLRDSLKTSINHETSVKVPFHSRSHHDPSENPCVDYTRVDACQT